MIRRNFARIAEFIIARLEFYADGACYIDSRMNLQCSLLILFNAEISFSENFHRIRLFKKSWIVISAVETRYSYYKNDYIYITAM